MDSRPFGGTCALRGCDPKKVLVGAAEVVDWARRMSGRGIRANGLRIDWSELMRFKGSFTDPVPKRREEAFASAGIKVFQGVARFSRPDAIQIGDVTLEGRFIVIATGAKPRRLEIPGEEYLAIGDNFLELDHLPETIVFVGGGYISFEFSHIAARAGAKATILHRGRRPLEGFDPDLVDRLVHRTREIGVRVELETAVEAVEKTSGGLAVHTSNGNQKKVFETEMVVHGAGRMPNIDDLNLQAAAVKRGSRGVEVNEYLQSASNPKVYAAGDAVSVGPPLTPVAGYDGQLVAENLLSGNHRKADYSVVPSVVFTVPPLARVGLQEEQARERNLKFRMHYEDTSDWYSSRRVGETHSAFKVLLEEDTGRIVGAHLLGFQAEEVINLFALAMRSGLRGQDLEQTLFSYPSHGSDASYML